MGQRPGQLEQARLRRRPPRAARPGRRARTRVRRTATTSASASAPAGTSMHGALAPWPGACRCCRRRSTSTASPKTASDSVDGAGLSGPGVRFADRQPSAGRRSYAINDHLHPYARVTWDREFEDAPDEAFAQSQSMPGTLPYAVPGMEHDEQLRHAGVRRAHEAVRAGCQHRRQRHRRQEWRQRRQRVRTFGSGSDRRAAALQCGKRGPRGALRSSRRRVANRVAKPRRGHRLRPTRV